MTPPIGFTGFTRPCKLWDLFCGGSGAGTGVLRGLRRLGFVPECVGVNHNKHAVATSRKNHPEQVFYQTGVEQLKPRQLFPDGAFFGWASPSCVFHSTARGGKPINDQERSSPYCVWKWAHQTRPVHILIENVPEFEGWCRLKQKTKKNKLVWMQWIWRNGKRRRVETTEVPIEQHSRTWQQYLRDLDRWGFEPCMIKDNAHKGEHFLQWAERGRELGYRIEWRVLNAADYGDPTSRRRLFIQCVRLDSGLEIVWPAPTHAKPDKEGKVPTGRLPWRTAREILDLPDHGPSIFERKKPLSAKTLRRIRIGLLKYGLGPYILPSQGYDDRTRSTDEPLQTVKTEDRSIALVQPAPFILPGFGERPTQEPRTHSVDTALPTVPAQGHLHLAQAKLVAQTEAELAQGKAAVQPFVLPHPRPNGDDPRSVDRPLNVITATSSDMGLVSSELKPLVIGMEHQGSVRSVDSGPLPTITTAKGGAMAVASPFILPQQAGGRNRSVDEPLPPLTSKGAEALITPTIASQFLVSSAHGNEAGKLNEDNRRTKPVDEPVPACTGSREFGLASALVKLKGTSTANSVDEPVGAVQAGGQHHALMSSVVKFYGTATARPITAPLDTLTAKARIGLVQPTITQAVVQTAHEGADASRVKSVKEPLPPVAGNRGDAAVVTFQVTGWDGGLQDAVLHFNGLLPGGTGRPVLEVGGQRYEIEIYFRMLKVVELARAQSFPEDYHFCGTKTDAIKQIGNAVPGRLAEALTIAAVSQQSDIRAFLQLAA